jgi:3-(3-hydroxy-phenyl)propionate hydroxylase
MTQATERSQIIIIGAGPVGLTVALGLARKGIRSVIFEKKPELAKHSRATVITPSSLEDFDRLGVLDEILAQGARNDQIRILRASDRKPMLTFDFTELAAETSTPFAVALSQDRTEKILLDAALATGLVHVHFNGAFERFEETKQTVLVHVAGSRVIETDWLIATDGAKSAVREQLGWKLEGETYPTRAVLADVRIDPSFDTVDGWLADPTAQSFTIAIRFAPSVWRIIEAAIPDDVADTDLHQRSQDICARLFGNDAWQDTIWTSAYRKHERRAERYVQRRIVLAGDAAHLNSPAGGQGLNTGIADAELLVSSLVQAMESPDQATPIMQHYETSRITAFDTHVRGLTDGLEKMESAPAWLRRMAFSAIGVLRAAGIEKFMARKLSGIDAT